MIKNGKNKMIIFHGELDLLPILWYTDIDRFVAKSNRMKNAREVMLENKLGIDHSYYYEGYYVFKTEDLTEKRSKRFWR